VVFKVVKEGACGALYVTGMMFDGGKGCFFLFSFILRKVVVLSSAMPERYTGRIMRILCRSDYHPLKHRALAHALNVPDEGYDLFGKAITLLERDGKIRTGKNRPITLADMPKRISGIYRATRKGFGFVIPDTAYAQGDLYIPFGQSLDAVSGDRVMARVLAPSRRGGEKRTSGRVTEILSRGNTQFVGTLAKQGRQWVFLPDGKTIMDKINVDDPGAKNAHAGDKVVVELMSYPSENQRAHGVIVEKLGKSGNSKGELKAILRRFNLAEKFKRATLNDTRRVIDKFDPENISKREDIRSEMIITIDPQDARDYDDAISLKKLRDDKWRLGVHIADVSYFVEADSALDKESIERGTSCYLPGQVIPMLPELLSNGVCSLQQDQDRFVKSAYIDLDKKGKVLKTCFANSVIRSTQRLTYENADDVVDGKTDGFDKKIVAMIKKMDTLAHILQKRRQKAGMLSLDLPSAELVFNDKGRVIDAKPESQTFSHTMIEMFMLEANEAVARLLDSLDVPFLRRIHPEPDALSMGDSLKVLKLGGYVVPKSLNRQGMQDLLNSVKGKPESFMINLAILKSLQRAEYSPTIQGHFALASQHYCHFTSPIRRYPDLMIHRLLQGYITGRLTKTKQSDFPTYEELLERGKQCSDLERNAEAAERELREYKLLQLIATRVGEETQAVVTSITRFGLFVQLEKFLIEGLIRPEDIPHDLKSRKKSKPHKPHRGQRHSIKSPHGRFEDNCPYRIGQKLTVKIANVNLPARMLDLVLVV
jgi:ribonuclease R